MADTGSKNYEKKWICHYCLDGPLSLKYDSSCPVCYHHRCNLCKIVKIFYRG